MFYTNMNGLNYRNAVISNGLRFAAGGSKLQLQLRSADNPYLH